MMPLGLFFLPLFLRGVLHLSLRGRRGAPVVPRQDGGTRSFASTAVVETRMPSPGMVAARSHLLVRLWRDGLILSAGPSVEGCSRADSIHWLGLASSFSPVHV